MAAAKEYGRGGCREHEKESLQRPTEIKMGEHASVRQSCAIFSNTALWPEGKRSCGVGHVRGGQGFKRLQLSRRRAEEAAKNTKKRACRDPLR